MPGFLSRAWLEAFEEALQAVDPGQLPTERVAIGQIVTDGPEGTTSYTIRFGGGLPAALERGTTEGADVTLVEDYEAARAIATGSAPNSFLAAGRIRVRGDTGVLLRAQEHFAAFQRVLGELTTE